MKRLLPLLVATFLISTVARAQSPAAEGEVSSPSSAPSEPAPTPPAEVSSPSSAPSEPAPTPPVEAEPPAPAPEVPDAAAKADPKPEKAPASDLPTVAVLPLEFNKAAEEDAPGIASLIASRLAESRQLRVLSQQDVEATLSAERQRQLLGAGKCAQGGCLEELSSLTGARYMVTGRLDRFGDTYLLTASLIDTVRGRSLAKPRAEASSPDELLHVAEAVGDQLLAELAPAADARPSRPLLGSARETPGSGLVLGLRINNSFISNLATLNPGGDLEVGYSFHPEWVGFLQVGISFIRSEEAGSRGSLRALPSVLGARHFYRLEHSFRPYWGLGLGVQLSLGQFGVFQNTGPLPTVIGFFGFEYLIAGRFGLTLETGTNLAQATLGLAGGGLGDGLNLDLNAGITYHF